MPVTANLEIKPVLTQDVKFSQNFPIVTNTNSPGNILKTNLISGNNTITMGAGAVGLLILPPVGNTATITLKGNAGDTGVQLHPTDPTYLAVGTTTSVILTTSGAISNIRFITI